MHPSCASGGNDHGLGPCHQIIAGLQVLKNRSCHLAFLILDQFHCSGKFHHRNLPVQHFIPQGPHDLRSGVVLAGMHPLSGSSAAMGGDHPSIFIFIKHYAQFIEPLDGVRRFHDQPLQKFRPCGKMSASKSVQIMLDRRIIFLVRRLDAALCHHGVGVADPKLGDDHHIRSGFICLNGCGSACAAAADHQYVHVIIHFVKVDFFP